MTGAAPNYFVTGGARGIGAGIVLQAIREGHDVAFAYKGNREAAAAVEKQAQELRPGSKCRGFVMDVSDPAQVTATGDEILDEFESIGVVVNCAGLGARELVGDLADEHPEVGIGRPGPELGDDEDPHRAGRAAGQRAAARREDPRRGRRREARLRRPRRLSKRAFNVYQYEVPDLQPCTAILCCAPGPGKVVRFAPRTRETCRRSREPVHRLTAENIAMLRQPAQAERPPSSMAASHLADNPETTREIAGKNFAGRDP